MHRPVSRDLVVALGAAALVYLFFSFDSPPAWQPIENVSTPVRSVLSPGLGLCTENPFIRGLSHAELERLEETWVEWQSGGYQRLYEVITRYMFAEGVEQDDSGYLLYHTRIGVDFADLAFPVKHPLPCPSGIVTYGKGGVGLGKQLCSLDALPADTPFVVFSLGSRNQFDFEEAVAADRRARVYTFDCTSSKPSVDIERVEFFPVCVGQNVDGKLLQLKLFPHQRPPSGWDVSIPDKLRAAKPMDLYELMDQLSVSRVHVLKMDVEGGEYSVFSSIFRSPEALKRAPYQISFESHFWHRDVGHATLSIDMFHELWRNGYRFIQREDQQDATCFEWTLLRVFC